MEDEDGIERIAAENYVSAALSKQYDIRQKMGGNLKVYNIVEQRY